MPAVMSAALSCYTSWTARTGRATRSVDADRAAGNFLARYSGRERGQGDGAFDLARTFMSLQSVVSRKGAGGREDSLMVVVLKKKEFDSAPLIYFPRSHAVTSRI
jgi:hypothetical protein